MAANQVPPLSPQCVCRCVTAKQLKNSSFSDSRTFQLRSSLFWIRQKAARRDTPADLLVLTNVLARSAILAWRVNGSWRICLIYGATDAFVDLQKLRRSLSAGISEVLSLLVEEISRKIVVRVVSFLQLENLYISDVFNL